MGWVILTGIPKEIPMSLQWYNSPGLRLVASGPAVIWTLFPFDLVVITNWADPDIAEAHGVAVVLQHDGTLGGMR